MLPMMTQSDFVQRAVGLPWVRWRSDWSACDCFGLVVLYYREVLGVELGDVPKTDIASGFDAASGWAECAQYDDAVCFMAWRGKAPTHCGILLESGSVLHCEGSPERPGNARVTPLPAMRRGYGDIRFYKRTEC